MASPVTLTAGTGDGYVRTSLTAFSTWAAACAETTNAAGVADYATQAEANSIGGYVSGGKYSVRRVFLPFDLSGGDPPSGATVSAVTVAVYRSGTSVRSTAIFQGTQASTSALAVGDMHAFTGAELATRVTWANGFNTFTLNSTGIAYVQSCIGGWAKFCLCDGAEDVDGASPGGLDTNGCYYANSTTSGYRPVIVITYSVATASFIPSIMQTHIFPSLSGGF